jgi:hypothetical protein
MYNAPSKEFSASAKQHMTLHLARSLTTNGPMGFQDE